MLWLVHLVLSRLPPLLWFPLPRQFDAVAYHQNGNEVLHVRPLPGLLWHMVPVHVSPASPSEEWNQGRSPTPGLRPFICIIN